LPLVFEAGLYTKALLFLDVGAAYAITSLDLILGLHSWRNVPSAKR
jgi:hypothetical protein